MSQNENAPSAESAQSVDGVPMKILIIEDDPILARRVMSCITAWLVLIGFGNPEIYEARSIEEMVKYFREYEGLKL
jgi:hypothetical protein